MNSNQPRIKNSSQEGGVIQFYGDIMVINGDEVPYGKQMLTNEMLYVTDLAMQIQISRQIDDYDQQYFLESLNQQIVAELQAAHSSIGIQILQQMDNLGTKSYSNLFLKLSIPKIKNILMDNPFYIFLSSTCRKLINGKDLDNYADAIQFERTLLNCLETSQKRILYLLDSLRRNQIQLRPAIEQTAQQLIFKIIGQTNFIQQLGYKQEKNNEDSQKLQVKNSQQTIINTDFLKELCEIIKTLQSLATTPNEIKQVYQFSNKSMLSQLLFTKQCLHIIGKHFEHFFLYDRKRLMLVLSQLAIHSNILLWFEVISYKKQAFNLIEEKKTQQQQINFPLSSVNQEDNIKHEQNIVKQMDNIHLFTQLTLSNFFSAERQTWDMNVFILVQLIQAKIKESGEMLTQIFLQIIENRLNPQDVTLITQFIKSQVQQAQSGNNEQIQLLMYTLITHIGIQVNNLFQQYRLKESKKFAESNMLKIIAFTGCEILKFPKVDSLKICAFLRVFIVFFQKRLLKGTIDIPYVLLLEKLLIMTKSRGGITSGVRKILIKQIEAYIAQRELEESKTVKVKQSIFTNYRKQFKPFRMTLQKQNPNSIDKLKRLLTI